MSDAGLRTAWQWPSVGQLEGTYVAVSRLNPAEDIHDLFEVSHAKEEFKLLWTYMHYGPFRDKEEMLAWLLSINDSHDPMFYSVFSKSLQKNVGMFAVMNINTRDGRAEFGNIWYSPLVQKSKVNTEVSYLFLCYLFDELRYRRVEWKCDNKNEPSKRAALRMGFSYEGVFRQHMVVKGMNRDTAWFAMLDSEWLDRKAAFEEFLSSDGVSLTTLTRRISNLHT